MDANTIRIILIVVGALLILALVLWERSRRLDDPDEHEDHAQQDAPYGLSHGKRGLRPWRAAKRTETTGADPASRGRASSGEPRRFEPDPEPESQPEPYRRDDNEPLLIQLSVSARRDPFDGMQLMDAAELCGLRPGRMDIFHCLDEFDDDTRIYFSMANMVKPGTFPFDAMEEFSTPGLMLFAQLDGRPEDMTILEEMIASARKLANELNGDVLDETRRPLTVSKEESLRQSVLENERRWARNAER
jgi:cell division protein ZipA